MAGDKLEFEGIVASARGNGMFIVKTNSDDGGNSVLCKLSGKIRQNNIKIIELDRVKIEVSPYDLSKGVIVYRAR